MSTILAKTFKYHFNSMSNYLLIFMGFEVFSKLLLVSFKKKKLAMRSKEVAIKKFITLLSKEIHWKQSKW